MASDRNNWPDPANAPLAEDLARCVHCGLCVNSCPTYLVTGLEVESPRGRIHLMKAVAEGRTTMTPTVQAHWELCLQCRACEAACPSGVPYGRLMEHTRAQLDAAPPRGRASRTARKCLLRHLVARPRVLALAMAPVRVLANSPLRPLARRSGFLRLIGPLSRAEEMLPPRVAQPFRAGDGPAQPVVVRNEAVLFTGCLMGELFGDVHRATGRVLARSGIAATNPSRQVCCGALSAHDGDLDYARKLARANIDAFGDDSRPIVVNSAGCGAAMKEYGELLAADPAYAERAERFAARVRDFSEIIAEAGAEVPASFPDRVTYQDPCHLAHAQRVREQPRQLLRGAGCDMVETAGSDTCCGAAGLYSTLQPEMAGALRSRKAEAFRKAKPGVVVTANPGCHLQYEAAVREAGIAARVMHLAEVLDEAQRNAETAGRGN